MSRRLKEAGLTKSDVVDLIEKHFGAEFNRGDLLELCSETLDINYPYWATRKEYRVTHGYYSVELLRNSISGDSTPKKTRKVKKVVESTPEPVAPVQSEVEAPAASAPVQSVQSFNLEPEENLIPSKDPLYIKWGAYKDVETIIKSKQFFPMFITGLSGNGKTTMIDQACANLKQPLIRVNFTRLTDEDQLIGGWRLVDGQTVWFDGPVVRAMKLGAVLLLDEVDLADEKVMCLQPILEGKGIFIKPIRQMVHHSEGFTIFATGNTKGQGDETGKFAGTFQMNEAFLERFPLTIEQPYPKKTQERKMLKKVFGKSDILSTEERDHYIEHLLEFVTQVRAAYDATIISEVISTRRLVQIVQTFLIFKDKNRSLELCLNRFNSDIQSALKEIYRGCEPKTKEQIEAEEAAAKAAKEEEEKAKTIESKYKSVVDAFNDVTT
jgi:MoxR-like ATPase